MFRDGVLLEEGLALAMAEAEEHHIDILEGHLVGERQVAIAHESFVHVAHQITGIALAVGKHNLGLRMVQQQPQQFAARIAGGP